MAREKELQRAPRSTMLPEFLTCKNTGIVWTNFKTFLIPEFDPKITVDRCNFNVTCLVWGQNKQLLHQVA
jgi:hypothetical protein